MAKTLLIAGGVSGCRTRSAEAILWLPPDEASFVTGAMLNAPGGGYMI